MSTQLKLRRGTTTQHSTFTGAEGEITIDTTKDTVVVHDGATAGGVPLAKESGSALSPTSVTLSTGTANGVVYLNGSKVLTTGSALTFDGTKLDVNGPSTGISLNLKDNSVADRLGFGYVTSTPINNITQAQVLANASGDLLLSSRTNFASGIIFYTNSGATATEQMRLTSTGLGIGTSSPGFGLDVNKQYAIVGTSGGEGGYLTRNSSGTLQWKVGQSGSSLQFLDFIAGAERMRIDSSGNVLVGKTTTLATTLGISLQGAGEIDTALAASLNSTTTLNVYSTSASAFRFYVGMAGTVYATTTTISAISDQRYKENVRDLDVGLDAIMALKPRKFDWKEGKGKDIKNDRGFIAQEFEQVFPDLIDEWKDPAPEGEEPYKSVRQDLIPVLVKAIQEQQEQINQLTARVAQLEGN